MGDIRIVTLTNQGPGFYPLLGPYLSQRQIVAELGFPIFDDSGKVWFITIDGDTVAGFGAVVFKADVVTFCSDYVLPAYRRRGIHNQLLSERLLYVGGKANSASAIVCNPARRNYERHGFGVIESRPLKNYTKMGKKL